MTVPPLSTDADLIARTRAGDMASYDELYRRHLDDTRRVARIVTGSNDEAEDVVAEAFTRVLARLRDGAGPDSELTPYLRTVVRRLAIDRYRSAGHGSRTADPEIFEAMPEPDDPIEIATSRDMLRQAYETLPGRWQEVLWRTEVEGRTPATLAAAFNSTPNAVAALAYRAREGLREAFLRIHLAGAVRPECQPFVPKISAYTRGSLAANEEPVVTAHLAQCGECRERRNEMLVLVSDLRSVAVPALLGIAATAGAAGAVGAAGATVTGGAAAGEAVGSAAASGSATVAGSGAADSAGQAAGSGRLLSKLRHLRPRGMNPSTGVIAGTIAVATALVAALIATVAIVGSPEDEPIAEPAPVVTDPVEAERPVAEPTEPTEPTTEAPSPPPPLPEPEPAEVTTNEAPVAALAPSPAAVDEPEPTPPTPSPEPAVASESTPEPEFVENSTPAPAQTPTFTPTPTSTPTPTPTATTTPTQTPTPTPTSPPPPGRPHWVCELIPDWPGCPGRPDRPIRDAVCARIPDLPFCRSGGA